MTGFGTVPADDKVIDDLADTAELLDGLADIHVIAIDVDHAFKTHAVGQSSDDKRRNVESFRRQKRSPHVGFELVDRSADSCRSGR